MFLFTTLNILSKNLIYFTNFTLTKFSKKIISKNYYIKYLLVLYLVSEYLNLFKYVIKSIELSYPDPDLLRNCEFFLIISLRKINNHKITILYKSIDN